MKYLSEIKKKIHLYYMLPLCNNYKDWMMFDLLNSDNNNNNKNKENNNQASKVYMNIILYSNIIYKKRLCVPLQTSINIFKALLI